MNAGSLFPRDYWNTVFGYLGVRNFGRMASVCRNWKNRIESEDIQRIIYNLSWNERLPQKLLQSQTWKQINSIQMQVKANLDKDQISLFKLELPKDDQGQPVPLTKIQIRDFLFLGEVNNRACVWGLDGRLVHFFEPNEKVIDVQDYRVLFYTPKMPNIFQIKDIQNYGVRYIFLPEGYTVDPEHLYIFFLNRSKMLIALKKQVEDKYHIEFSVIDTIDGSDKVEKLPQYEFVINADPSTLRTFFESLAMATSSDCNVHIVPRHEGKVIQSKLMSDKLAVIRQTLNQGNPQTVVDICNLKTGDVVTRNHPFIRPIQLIENFIVESNTSNNLINLVDVHTNKIVKSFNLIQILKDQIENIHEIKACYAKGYLFVLLKVKDNYEFLYKINTKDMSMQEIFPRIFFLEDSSRAPHVVGPQHARLMWMGNRLLIPYAKGRESGVLVFNYAQDTLLNPSPQLNKFRATGT